MDRRIYGVRSRFHIAPLASWTQVAGSTIEGNSAMDRPPVDRSRGVYGISVAAELVEMGVQNLRLYESRGLVRPARTVGGTRRYSMEDLDTLHRIRQLLQAGLNLAGISMVLDLEAENRELHAGRHNSASNANTPRPRGRKT
jgi:MerR family transcriptional regulator, heat shock protein HspR